MIVGRCSYCTDPPTPLVSVSVWALVSVSERTIFYLPLPPVPAVVVFAPNENPPVEPVVPDVALVLGVPPKEKPPPPPPPKLNDILPRFLSEI